MAGNYPFATKGIDRDRLKFRIGRTKIETVVRAKLIQRFKEDLKSNEELKERHKNEELKVSHIKGVSQAIGNAIQIFINTQEDFQINKGYLDDIKTFNNGDFFDVGTIGRIFTNPSKGAGVNLHTLDLVIKYVYKDSKATFIDKFIHNWEDIDQYIAQDFHNTYSSVKEALNLSSEKGSPKSNKDFNFLYCKFDENCKPLSELDKSDNKIRNDPSIDCLLYTSPSPRDRG